MLSLPPPVRAQVPDTSILDRFLDSEDLLMGKCKEECMDPGTFDKEE